MKWQHDHKSQVTTYVRDSWPEGIRVSISTQYLAFNDKTLIDPQVKFLVEFFRPWWTAHPCSDIGPGPGRSASDKSDKTCFVALFYQEILSDLSYEGGRITRPYECIYVTYSTGKLITIRIRSPDWVRILSEPYLGVLIWQPILGLPSFSGHLGRNQRWGKISLVIN